MIHTVKFINLEETEKDLIIAFAIDDHEFDINSLTLLRTFFFEELLPEEERGVYVTLEGDSFEQEDFNMLNNINISDGVILIKSTFREYRLDISKLEKADIEKMVKLLTKQFNTECKYAVLLCYTLYLRQVMQALELYGCPLFFAPIVALSTK